MIFTRALLIVILSASPIQAAGGWVKLFNGKNLEGWTPKIRGYALGENYGDTFRASGGILSVHYDKYDKFEDRFGHLFYKTPYSKYRFRFEYRFKGESCPGAPGWAWRNSGVMVHGQDPATMDIHQAFPVCIEVQLLGGGPSGERSTANLCSPGTHVVMGGKLETQHCVNSSSATFRGDSWVKFEVEVLGSGVIRHFVEGKQVMEYQEPQLDPGDGDAEKLIRDGVLLLDRGTISLQAEGHPVEFRKIEIKEIP